MKKRLYIAVFFLSGCTSYEWRLDDTGFWQHCQKGGACAQEMQCFKPDQVMPESWI